MKTEMAYLMLVTLLLFVSIAAADNAMFAGGCFWNMASDFINMEGVTDVVSGKTDGMLQTRWNSDWAEWN
ncbi:MAG: hypothetical protein AMJ53_12185 [Gammaproteobacteria bacterium SG8_11]|nr:MAG: hypothetical protein AMJ53_12185 [Gammaproteobacteria bacterium SG8_11]